MQFVAVVELAANTARLGEPGHNVPQPDHMRLAAGVGIVLVTSPARVHPSTELLWAALGSTTLLRGLGEAPISIVCDGYRTPDETDDPQRSAKLEARLRRDPCSLSKRGIVSSGVGAAYEEYKRRLAAEVAARGLRERISIATLDSHHGFALCVRHGLALCADRGDRFALVLQHDRAFIRRLEAADLEAVLGRLERDESCKYVGFASGTSKLISTQLQPRYKLGRLLEARARPLRAGLRLVPTVFWWDSNHLVHVARARRLLFEPFAHAPAALRARAGALTLRRADFIEDRFGVEQKAILTVCTAFVSRLHHLA